MIIKNDAQYFDYLLKALYNKQTICITDAEGNYIYLSDGAAERLGCSTEELLDHNVYTIESQGLFINNPITKVIETQKPQIAIGTYSSTGMKALVYSEPIFNDQETFVMTISFIITMKEMLERTGNDINLTGTFPDYPLKTDLANMLLKNNKNIEELFNANIDADYEIKKFAVSKLLQEIGVPTHLKGYHYLLEAILIAVEEKEAVHAMTKRLYPEVAKKFNSSACSVERDIRNAIEATWSKCDLERLKKHFKFVVNQADARPSNRKFISAITHYWLINDKRTLPFILSGFLMAIYSISVSIS